MTADPINSFQPFQLSFPLLRKADQSNNDSSKKNATNTQLTKKVLNPKRKQLKNYVTSALTAHSPIASAAPATTWGQ